MLKKIVFRPKNKQIFFKTQKKYSENGFKQTLNAKKGLKLLGGATILALGTTIAYNNISKNKLMASEDAAHAPVYPWHHSKLTGAFDKKAVRRGYQVYKEVCASCHGMNRISFRNLVGVAYTDAEVKAIAESVEVDGEPDEQGNPTKRPAVVADIFPEPYKNEQEARYNNAGALPPDLSLVVRARDEGEDYIFSLLTGYDEAPHGMEVRTGLSYNPYFPGGLIGMPPPLVDGMVEFEDGTPATVSQMSRDVTTFLTFTSYREQDERKLMGLKAVLGMILITCGVFYHKRFRWSLLKSRRITFEK